MSVSGISVPSWWLGEGAVEPNAVDRPQWHSCGPQHSCLSVAESLCFWCFVQKMPYPASALIQVSDLANAYPLLSPTRRARRQCVPHKCSSFAISSHLQPLLLLAAPSWCLLNSYLGNSDTRTALFFKIPKSQHKNHFSSGFLQLLGIF